MDTGRRLRWQEVLAAWRIEAIERHKNESCNLEVFYDINVHQYPMFVFYMTSKRETTDIVRNINCHCTEPGESSTHWSIFTDGL